MFLENLLCNPVDSYDIFEGMTVISAIINSVISGENNRKIVAVLYDGAKRDKNIHKISFLKTMSEKLGFRLIEVSNSYIDGFVSGKTHGGFVAICKKRQLASLADADIVTNENSFYVLLEGIEDPYNFGYSLRSLYTFGADGIILPPRNWLEMSGVVARSSAGCSELAKLYVSEPEQAVNIFKEKGFYVICAGIRDSVSIEDIDFDKPILLIVGGEKRGISRRLIDMCDDVVRIDYARAFKGSLPTVSAVSIIAYEISRQKKTK